jgi:hypothetical protein
MTTTEPSYQLSPRVTLTPGDSFRVSRGPYMRTASGDRIPLAARGTFRLVEVIRRGSVISLLGYGREGYALIHVAGRRRSRSVPGLVCRPYLVRRAGAREKKIRRARKAVESRA